MTSFLQESVVVKLINNFCVNSELIYTKRDVKVKSLCSKTLQAEHSFE